MRVVDHRLVHALLALRARTNLRLATAHVFPVKRVRTQSQLPMLRWARQAARLAVWARMPPLRAAIRARVVNRAQPALSATIAVWAVLDLASLASRVSTRKSRARGRRSARHVSWAASATKWSGPTTAVLHELCTTQLLTAKTVQRERTTLNGARLSALHAVIVLLANTAQAAGMPQ